MVCIMPVITIRKVLSYSVIYGRKIKNIRKKLTYDVSVRQSECVSVWQLLMFDLSVPGLLAQSVSWLVSSARQAYSLSLTSHHTMLYKQSAASSSTNTNLTSLRDKHKSPPQPSPHSSPIYSKFHITPQ